MPVDHTEKGFEQAIEYHLLGHGYAKGDPARFDRRLALDPATLVGFLQTTQPKEWAKLSSAYGAEVGAKVVETVARDLDTRGLLDCLRHGVTDRGVKLRLAFFKPATGLNPVTLALYGQNVLSVTRQVHYSEKNPSLSIDLVLIVNGLPVATAELKNPFTGQNVTHAKRQYEDRDNREPLFQFKRRALVHFAVDPDEVYTTTRLDGKRTVFLPFNKGRGGGQGNPEHPTGWRTAYLWEEVWQRDSWLDVLARFLHLAVKEERQADKLVRQESVIFPRYHQLDAVRKLLASASARGPGKNYLVQHSAGSGKSNTIGWLAHRLSNLHDATDKLVYDSVVIITDRRVLDKQLQDTVYQFEHAQGVVRRIDQDSAQLAAALNAGARVVITTLQKFSFVLDKVKEAPARNYAVVVDEAHSSQTGESAGHLRRALAGGEAEDSTGDDAEEEILRVVKARGPQKNLSFFAFTATPKHKTLELFGEDGPDGRPVPFHLYTMRQAIEEGFILDVLEHYCTYKTYYRLGKAVEDDPEVDKRRALQAAARFVSLHPHNLAQKTEVMVEHFRQFTRHKIGGRAKAMVVTGSRKHAVRYKLAFDKYLKEKGYADIGVLVAFSGTVEDDGAEFTEPGMNHLGFNELPGKFNTDVYHVLIVAEKYQTGFDQPLLHTMFVDKKLDGLHAVQTLSRLNRTYPGKEDTFVLDFVNEAEDIKEAFKPYYEATEVEGRVDPHLLYGLKHKLDGFQIYWRQEVEDFALVFFKPAARQREQDKGLLHKYVNPAAERFGKEPAERQLEFRHELGNYLRLYAFLSQVVDFHDTDLEKLYAFGRLLLGKLRLPDAVGPLALDDEVRLAYYRLSKTYVGNASLSPGDTATVSGPMEVGTGVGTEAEAARLSEIVQVLNERFGTDLGPADQLWFEQVVTDMTGDAELGDQARTNALDQFKLAFDPKAMEAVLLRMERNEKIASQFLTNEQMRVVAMELMMREVYKRLRAASASTP